MSENDNNTPQLPPAGWYPDPHDAAGQRYWDGAQWTEHAAVPTSASAAIAAANVGHGSGVPGAAAQGDAGRGSAGQGPAVRRSPAAGAASATGAADTIAVAHKRGLPTLKWWQWGLVALGALVLISVIVGSLGGARGDADAVYPAPTATSQAREVEAPAPKPVDDREKMPGLVGLTVAEARAAVESAGFVMTLPDGTGDDWVVLTQTLSAGRQADPGTEVLVTAEAPKPVYTLAQQNAINKAQDYLAYSGFSRTGLIDQLEYEGYSAEDATFGADNAGADWNAECAEKAKAYLDYSSFSRQGLYDQLAYEGFTDAEIQFGLAAVGY